MYFITGNKNKFLEAQKLLPNLLQLDIDLAEIQDIDPHKIIEAKLLEAKRHINDSFFVEDTSLYIEALWWLPGPLIKWFLDALHIQGIYNVVEKLGNTKATAKTIVWYYDHTNDTITYFEWANEGDIVSPRWETVFWRDPIFQPAWYEDTFATMDHDIKMDISMRRLAIEKLKVYLNEK